MDPQEQAEIKIYDHYDHQGHAMEHPGQAVAANTSDTPFLYSLPAPRTIERIGDWLSLRYKPLLVFF